MSDYDPTRRPGMYQTSSEATRKLGQGCGVLIVVLAALFALGLVVGLWKLIL